MYILAEIVDKSIKRINGMLKKNGYRLFYLNRISIGSKTVLYPKTHIVINGKGRIRIGKGCFFNRNCSINSLKMIKIGDDCIFGENVCLYDHNHKFRNKDIEIKKQGYSCKDIIIEKNCWFGSNVVVLAGSHIGEGAVIGAGCIISGSVKPFTIVKRKEGYDYEERT